VTWLRMEVEVDIDPEGEDPAIYGEALVLAYIRGQFDDEPDVHLVSAEWVT
jgi:hypothetical protein